MLKTRLVVCLVAAALLPLSAGHAADGPAMATEAVQLLIRNAGPQDRPVSTLCLYEQASEDRLALPEGCGRLLLCYAIPATEWRRIAEIGSRTLAGAADRPAYKFGAFSFTLSGPDDRVERTLSPPDSAALLRELAGVVADADLRARLSQRAAMGAP